MPHHSLEHQAFEAFCRTLRVLQTRTAPVWLELDLTLPQLKTLFTLADLGPAPIGQIGEALQIGQPTASHLVKRLVQAGLATRAEDPLDRRRTLAHLTPAGKELVGRLQGAYQLDQLLVLLPAADLRALLRRLRAL
jgi:DNA-binding MarR family transcriptional regulator